MTDTTPIAADDTVRFPSLEAFWLAHQDLLKRYRADGNTSEINAAIEAFIQRGRVTGALLEGADRLVAQSQLDYWVTRLYQPGKEPLDGTLDDFDPSFAPTIDDDRCPYVGLDAFSEAKHNLFFGRKNLIGELTRKLQAVPLLAVAGSSGSGKSSVVRAGLIPALKAGALTGSADWNYLRPIVPGSNPLTNLAQLMLPAQADIAAEVDRYSRDAHYLSQVAAARSQHPIVLVIDQFEEVFTLCTDRVVREAFANNLVGLVQLPEVAHRVIVTIRTDFESYVTTLPEFYELFQQGLAYVTPFVASELREAIEGPAAPIGLRFEERLVETLVQDTLGEPAALPLLQFTLLKLWEKRERNRVTMAAYRLLGGRGALGRAADDFYGKLIQEEKDTARRILLKMVLPSSEGLEITSNRVLRSELYHKAEDPGRIERGLGKLIKARLVRVSQGDTAAGDQFEVAHEALIRNWPELGKWVEEERVKRRQRLRLKAAAEQWERLNRDPTALWRGALLEEARGYDDLNILEAEFVEAGQTAEYVARQREEARQKKEAETLRQRARYLRAALIFAGAALAFALLLAIALGALAFERSQAADAAIHSQAVAVAASRFALARQLTAQSSSRIDSRLDLALLLSIESSRITDTVEARSTLLTELERSSGLVTILRGHSGAVQSIAFSPDGKRLASGSSDTTITLWDVSNPQAPVRSGALLRGHSDAVQSIAFSPDGKRLASGSADTTIILWDVSNPQAPVSQTLRGDRDAVQSVAFSPDDKLLASGTRANTIILWDVSKPLAPVPAGEPLSSSGAVQSVAFSPDGKMLASGNFDKTIILWDVSDPQSPVQLGAPLTGSSAVQSVAFSPDGTMLAASDEDNKITLWVVSNPQSPAQLGAPLEGNSAVQSVAFSPDRKTLASGNGDKTITLWDISKPRSPAQLGEPLRGHGEAVTSVTFSPDGKTLASGSTDAAIILWGVPNPRSPVQLGAPLSGHGDMVQGVAFSPDGLILASGSWDKTIILWDVSKPQWPVRLGAPLRGHGSEVASVAFSPGRPGRTLASGNFDKTITLWDVSNPQSPVSQTLTGHEDQVWSVAFSPDGQTLASGSWDKTIFLWDVSNPQSPVQLGAPLRGHSEAVTSVTFSPDGKTLASGSSDKTIVLWDVSNRQLPVQLGAPLNGYAGAVNSLAFSPNGRTLASGNVDKTILLWDVSKPQLPVRLGASLKSDDAVQSVAFSPDGNMLAAGSKDNRVTLWDVSNPKTPVQLGLPLHGHGGAVTSVAFSRDGKILASGSEDTGIILWDVNLDSWRKHACQMAGHNFNPMEWDQYLGEDSHRKTCEQWPLEPEATLIPEPTFTP